MGREEGVGSVLSAGDQPVQRPAGERSVIYLRN